MQWTDNVLNRDMARENGLVVLEPVSQYYKAVLKDDEFAVIQFQSLNSFDGYAGGFGIVAISKPTEEKWVILQATPHDDLKGLYYTFPSTSVIVEATRIGISQVNKHLRKFWSFDDLMQTESFKVETTQRSSDTEIAVTKKAVKEPSFRKKPPAEQTINRIRESYRQQKSAESLLSAINKTHAAGHKQGSTSRPQNISWLFKDATFSNKPAGLSS